MGDLLGHPKSFASPPGTIIDDVPSHRLFNIVRLLQIAYPDDPAASVRIREWVIISFHVTYGVSIHSQTSTRSDEALNPGDVAALRHH
jgi:hypothetical protein